MQKQRCYIFPLLGERVRVRGLKVYSNRMAVPTYTVALKYIKPLAPGVYELLFDKPAGFTFKAGQFILFDMPLVGNATDIQPRAYSIASSPLEPDLLFVIKVTPGGRTSRWMEEVAKEGSELVMKGPFGPFTLDETTEKNYLMVATGTGLAPFRSHVKYLLEEKGDTRKIDLIFGVRNKEDLFWTEIFERYEQQFANFKFHISLTGDIADWHGHHGRVQQIIPQIVSDFSTVHVYICGAPPMVKDVKAKCIDEWKMDKKDVHGEGYI